ncbi:MULTISPECIES: hypothetical protein [Roseobacter]|uniref:DUF4239 domain-containing protein n=1 Tax=Roseobacter litoralis (strain ATCC 49566 / DSM 6996 / JCM 21268 / NBRC 15278 / OCh 149) TaxID=391595 RepID=F7ZDI0_ROSLO|nr:MULTISPECIES: hypothetical protein [Roseobacter]AEI94582.1 hypothetical protein RLO149_c026190 [Roseobacter litoralis Och 149]GIT88036.1 hypothetical protein ROBYS_30520 [Roseobacter sp. OBYS 0001]
MINSTFDVLPLWGTFALSLAIFFAATEIGFRIGLRRREHADFVESGSTGIVTGSILGLVSFLLAFTFGIAATNYSERRGVVLDEANSIGTAFLRADLLEAEDRSKLRELLAEYTRIRVEIIQPETKVAEYFSVIRASERLHSDMWQTVVAAARANPTPTHAVAVTAINDVIDIHTTRVAVGVRYAIPPSIWLALYVVSAIGLATTSYRFGVSFGRRSELLPGMVFAFASVITLITDLDNPRHGFLLSDQTPMQELLTSMSKEN